MELKPGYKQTELGVIPEDWDVRRLSDLAKIRSGIAKNANTSLCNPVTIPYLRVANVQDGFLDLGEVSSISIARDDLERYLLRPGDVLMNEGGDLDKLGRGAIWRGELKQCIHQNHVFAIRCTSALLPEYLNAWSSGKAARRYFVVAGKQTTNLASINKTAIGGLPIALPSPREQQQIAEAIDSLSAHEASIEDLVLKKRQIKQAAMQELLTGKRRLPGFEGEWEVKRLGELCSMKSGESITAKSIDAVSPFPCYGGNGQRGFTMRFTHEGDYCLIGRVGALCGNLLKVSGQFFASEHAIVVRAFENVDVAWLTLALGTLNLNRRAESSAQPVLTVSKLLPLEVNVPSTKQEQTTIATVLSDMDAELVSLEARLDKARELKQGMMQQLLTGKIRLI